MLIVQKYGGTSLQDTPRLHAAARRVATQVHNGHKVVVVVSAQGHTTDALLETAGTVTQTPSPRELDAYLSAGEQLSAALMAMALESCNIPAVSLTGWQAGIYTDDTHTNARILQLGNRRIQAELEAGKVVVVAGFQGIDLKGDITTLGRGGSDTTAVALAAFLQADLCQIFTDVDGVYDRDPRKFPHAAKFRTIDYDHMLRLAENGAQVLHDRSVALAKAHGLVLEVRSAFTDAPGTLVGP